MVFTKKVKTKADLNALALDTGASVAQGNKQFNAEKRLAAKPKRLEKDPDAVQLPKAEPVPEPKPEPVSDPGLKILADQMAADRTVYTGILEGIREQISQIQLSAAQPPIGWDFDFIRDDKGYLDHVRAMGIFPIREKLN